MRILALLTLMLAVLACIGFMGHMIRTEPGAIIVHLLCLTGIGSASTLAVILIRDP